jgi:signal transduction histidine kinase/PAS domain-containing protein
MLRHPRLASLATREWPAWLWSADGSRILWANAAGAAIFGAATASACGQRRFYLNDLAAAQVIHLAATLPAGGQERLERLRGFGGKLGRPLTCACARVADEDGDGAVLVAATEAAGPVLPLAERVRRLFEDDTAPVAVFLPDGRLLYANGAGQKRLGSAGRLDALGLGLASFADSPLQPGATKASARLNGESFDVHIASLGENGSSVLLVLMPHAGAAPSGPDMVKAARPESQRQASPVTLHAAPAAPAAQPQGTGVQAEPRPERRHPLRFVWEMDADGRFIITSDDFIQLAGPRAALLGRPWREIATALQLDPADRVATAVASRETWSGITVSWPVGAGEDSGQRLPVELSGLPVFDRDRNFRGYRGFGVCRDLAHINGLAQTRHEHQAQVSAPAIPPEAKAEREAPAHQMPAIAHSEATSAISEHPAAELDPDLADPDLANVVPFRPAPAVEPKSAPGLSPVERKAFRELAQELSSRLRGGPAPAADEMSGALNPTASEDPSGAPAGTPSEPVPEAARLRAQAPSAAEGQSERNALRTASAKAQFVAKISHEIRTPLTAINGFAEAIMAERFGPIGNERYREYIKDIHVAAAHLSSMINDLFDLSKVETGRIELTFANINLNDLTQQCVGIMQPQANRARIIIRTALTTGLPPVMADERALRQIVLNLLSNSIKFTGPGGQIIVSTVFSDAREAILRVRDTGAGMSEKDIQAALEPFGDIATSASWGSGGAGFGLPLTKVLAEANHAHFSIKSAPEAGTLIEIAFPPNRLVAA